MNPAELRRQAHEAAQRAQTIWHRHDGDGQEHTAEELREFDELVARAEQLRTQADQVEARERRLNALDASSQESNGRRSQPTAADLPHNDPRNTRNGYHGYSIMRVAMARLENRQVDGIEAETHAELIKRRAAGGHTVNGVLVPNDLPVDLRVAGAYARRHGLGDPDGYERRGDLTTTTGTGAVNTYTLPTWIELLRVRTLMAMLGAKILTDMQGNFNIPRQSGAATFYVVNPESSGVTKSNQTLDNVAYSPRTGGAQTVYTRSFLHQSSIDAEMFVRNDLNKVMSIGLDNVGFSGSGSGAYPTGIVNNSSAGVVAVGTNGGAPDWTIVTGLEKVVEIANALDGQLAYVTSPKGRYKLKNVVRSSNTAGKYLWDIETNTVNGYPAYSTNQIASNLTKGSGTGLTALIFGNFAEALYAFWGGMDVIVNPFTNSSTGAVELTMLQDFDFHVRHDASFGVCKDLDPA